jgi:hypothetical protein
VIHKAKQILIFTKIPTREITERINVTRAHPKWEKVFRKFGDNVYF